MRFFLTFFLALAAHAQTATISDALTAAVGGGNWTGRVTVTLNAPGSAQPLYSGTTSLAGWSATYCVGVTGSDCTATTAAGVITATLYTNDAITPAGTSYTARFQPSRGPQWSETWTVSAGNTKLYQIRSTTVPTPTTTFTAGQLALAAGRLLYGNSSGVATALAPGTNGHFLSLSAGYPVWSAAVSSITGTANQITSSASAGAVTLSIPDSPTLPGTTTGTFSGPLTGNVSGNATTATSLAANPADCGANQYASAIAANGDLTCAQVSFSQLSGTSAVVIGAGNLTTVGAVPYVSASGTLQQDAAALFWDAANNELGIGTNTPAFALDVSGLASTARIYDQTATTGSSLLQVRAGAGQNGDIFQIVATNGSTKLFYADQNGRPTANDAYYIGASGAVWGVANGVVSHRSDGAINWASTTNATSAKDIGLARAAAGNLAVTNGSSGRGRIVLIQSTPAASTDACIAGALWSDANYVYACTSSGVIKRATLNTF